MESVDWYGGTGSDADADDAGSAVSVLDLSLFPNMVVKC